MSNYAFLVTDLTEACDNDSTEFSDYIPKIINRAEERLTRDLDDYGLVTYTSVALSASNNEFALPTGCRIIKNLNAQIGGSKINLLLRTDEYLNDYWPKANSSTSNPKYYARLTDTSCRVAPTQASTLDAEVIYISRPTTLTSANNTNYFTSSTYDALFYGCMIECMVFQKNFSIVPYFEDRYRGAVESLRNQARRTRRDDLQTPNSPAGGDNTIITGAN